MLRRCKAVSRPFPGFSRRIPSQRSPDIALVQLGSLLTSETFHWLLIPALASDWPARKLPGKPPNPKLNRILHDKISSEICLREWRVVVFCRPSADIEFDVFLSAS